MPSLLSIAFRSLVSSPLRSALTLVGVALGTAVVSATFATNVALEESLRATALTVVGSADVVVEAADEEGFPLAAARQVQVNPGVALAAPQVQKRTFYRTPTQRGFVQLLGIDPVLGPSIRAYPLAAGRFFGDPEERAVLVVKEWADRSGLQVGDSVDLMTVEGFQPFPVVGLLDETDLSQGSFGGIVRVPLAVAQSAFGLQDRVHLLSLQLAPGTSLSAVDQVLSTTIPGVYLVKETPRVLEDLHASIREFQGTLFFFGSVALLAGALLVFNTLSLSVAERIREIGLLRASGATPAAVLRMTLAQGTLLGVLGSVPGVVFGQALAWVLAASVVASQHIPLAGVPISLPGIGVSLALGVLVTLLGSLPPAIRAARTPLLQAVSGGSRSGAAPWSRRRAVGAVMALFSTMVILLAPVDADWLAVQAISLLVLFGSLTYLSAMALPVLTALCAAPYRVLFKRVGLLAERNVRREQSRTALTVGGLVISLSLVLALFNGTASFAATGEEWTQALFPGEFLVTSPVPQPESLVAELQAVPGVDLVSPVSLFPVVWDGLYVTAAAVDPSTYFQAFQFRNGERTSAFREMRRGPAVLVPARLAEEKVIALGDTMALEQGGRKAAFTVVGLIAQSFPTPDNYGAVVVPRMVAREAFGLDTFRFLAITAEPGAELGRVERELAETAELFGMESTSLSSLRETVGRGVSRLLGVLAGLVLIGTVVGALSVVNTMLLNISQRAREIAVLRAQGMTPRQVQAMALAEASVLGLVGAVVGVGVGALLTKALVDLARAPDFEPQFTFSLGAALMVVVVGLATATLSALYPSALAARTSVVDALRRR